jgi:S1-C subfamily serine protease
MGGTVTSELSEEKDLGTVDGVYVSEVIADGAAQEAGIEVGDVIVAVDGAKIKSMARMQEMFTKHQPGDKVKITVLRKNSLICFMTLSKSTLLTVRLCSFI